MGTQPPWFIFEKEATFTFISISFVFFLPVKIIRHSIFGSYSVFCIEKDPFICIFPSLTSFYFEKSSWLGVWPVWLFWLRKIALYGDSATMVHFSKRSVFHVCFNIIRILFAC